MSPGVDQAAGLRQGAEASPILLVDDHPPNLLALEAVLAPLGQPLVKASSGEETLRLLLGGDFAAILLDVQMPGLDGFETARLIKSRERSRKIPILFVTAISREEAHVVRGYAEGAVDYLLKPLVPEVVRAKVSTFVALHQQELQLRRQARQLAASAAEERARLEVAVQRATAEAEAGRRHLRSLLLEAPAAIAALRGPELRFELVNDGYSRLVGKPRERLLGRPGREALPELAEQGVWDLIDRVYASGQPFVGKEFAARLDRRADGSLDPGLFNFTAQPTRGPSGQVEGVLLFAVEVTEQVRGRERVEALARETEQQRGWLEAVLDQMATPLLLVEKPSGRLRFANRAAHALAGGTFPGADSVADDPARFEVTDAQGRPLGPEETPVARAVRGEELRGLEVGWRVGGRLLPLVVSSVSLPPAFGHEPTLVISFVDVSPFKQAEDELRQAVRLRDDFLSIASHELNTPLTPLKTQVQLLRRRLEAGPEGERMLALAERQVQRLTNLVAELLDVSRIASGRLPLEPEALDLAELAAEVVARLPDEARAQVVLRAAPAPGRWDRLRLDQVLSNLLSNALKYGAGRPVEVTVEARPGQVRVAVVDQGIGIPEDEQARIFERFERAVSSRNYGGFGLGLWIAREVVAAHGGAISVTSQPGVGSTFAITLPA